MSDFSGRKALVLASNAVAGRTTSNGAQYVSDALATSTLASTYPTLCYRASDGRYWRLIPVAGAIALEAAGAVPNDTSAAAANTTALTKALAYLSVVCGGGVLSCGAGTFTFTSGTQVNVASNVTIRGAGPATIWQVLDQRAAYLLGTAGAVSDVRIENLTFKARVGLGYVTRGHVRGCKFVGDLSSTTQYGETGVAVASYFGGSGEGYDDGTGAISASGSGWTHTLASPVMTTALSYTLFSGSAFARYVVSDFIPLDPTKRYFLRFDSGFCTGTGGAAPRVYCYDASKVALDSGQGFTPSNRFDQNQHWQDGGPLSFIRDTSYIRIGVGSYRPIDAAVGLSAAWDLSKIAIYEMKNDYASITTSAYINGLPSQLIVNASTDFIIADNDFTMWAGTSCSLQSSTDCAIIGNRFRYVLTATADTSGLRNRVVENVVDARMYTTGGSLIGLRPWRKAVIGGSLSDAGEYSRNRIVGAGWGIEVTNQNEHTAMAPSYTATVNDNVIVAEYCGISMWRYKYVANGNVIDLASDGAIGIEAPGDGATGEYGFVISVCENNVIRWAEMSGYVGAGYAISETGGTTIKGGFVRAPYLVSNTGTLTPGVVEIDGLSGEYGCSAVLSQAGPLIANFGRITPYAVQIFPRGAGGSGAVFDVQPNSTSHRQYFGASSVANATCPVITATGAKLLTFKLPKIDLSTYIPAYWIKLTPPTSSECYWAFNEIAFNDIPGGANSFYWAYNTVSSFIGNSTITMKNCTWAGRGLEPVSGSYSRGILRGTPALTGSTTVSSTTLAAGASITVANVDVVGVSTSRTNAANFRSSVVGGMTGLRATAWATADDKATVELTNITGGSLTVPAQTLFLKMEQYS